MVQKITANTTRDQDPTRTITLRAAYVADMTRRFRELQRRIRTKLIDENFLEPVRVTNNKLTINVFEYTNSAEKLDDFMTWLLVQEEQLILERVTIPGALPLTRNQVPWANTYLDSAYQKGIRQARADLGVAGVDPLVVAPNSVLAAFNSPIHAETVELIYTRNFNELKGITNAMDQQISRVLAQGMVDGQGVAQIARNINNRVDKIGITRARLLARTEVVHTFNQAALNTYQSVGDFLGEEIYVKWWTARDADVRPRHRRRHGKIYVREDAQRLIGEPNCRCSLIPYVPSIEGIPEDDQWGTVNPMRLAA